MLLQVILGKYNAEMPHEIGQLTQFNTERARPKQAQAELEDSVPHKAVSCRSVALSSKMNIRDQLYFQYTTWQITSASDPVAVGYGMKCTPFSDIHLSSAGGTETEACLTHTPIGCRST